MTFRFVRSFESDQLLIFVHRDNFLMNNYFRRSTDLSCFLPNRSVGGFSDYANTGASSLKPSVPMIATDDSRIKNCLVNVTSPKLIDRLSRRSHGPSSFRERCGNDDLSIPRIRAVSAFQEVSLYREPFLCTV